jgi:hypothetical protein
MNITGQFKNVSKAYSLKSLEQLNPNCPGMIIGRSSTKCVFFMPIVSEKKRFETFFP